METFWYLIMKLRASRLIGLIFMKTPLEIARDHSPFERQTLVKVEIKFGMGDHIYFEITQGESL